MNAKKLLFLGLALITALCNQAVSYTVPIAPGWNLIANQIDGANGNGIRIIIPNPPINSQVRRFDLASKSFQTLETYTATAGWQPGTNILNPGDGLFFFNPTADAFSLSLNGFPHVPVLPLNIGSGVVLVARQTNDLANPTNILGYAPPNNTLVYRFNPGLGYDPYVLAPPGYTIYLLKSGAWTPSAPDNIRVGESIWITTNGQPPAITQEPRSQSVCPGDRVVLSVQVTGSPPLSYQWYLNGSALADGTNSVYTIPNVQQINLGDYSVRVGNPLGTVTSSSATLSGDLRPPTLSCPSIVDAECQGGQGTIVYFTVTATDDCDPAPRVICNPPSGSPFPVGISTVNCIAFDSSLNTNYCDFKVNVIDYYSPILRCPPDRTVAASSPDGAVVNYNVTAFDPCDTNVIVHCDPPSGWTFPLGSTAVRCSAKNTSGNTSQCGFTITVVPPSCCEGKYWTDSYERGPGPRNGHAMAYDSLRGRVVLFGGMGSQGAEGDTWEWDGSTWMQVAETGPSPRAFHAMAYDSALGVVILFGGTDSKVAYDDTWAFDGAVWTPYTIKGPDARSRHAMAYDSLRQRIVVFGGATLSGTTLGDTWEFDGFLWKQVGGTGGPEPRFNHAMAYDAAARLTVLYGGYGRNSLDDTWGWDGDKWNLLADKGPGARFGHAMAYDDNCGATVMFGGTAIGAGLFSDTWEWDGARWSLQSSNIPSARFYTAMAHDSANAQTVLYGGLGLDNVILSDTALRGTDHTPPLIRSVYFRCGDSNIIVTFSKPVDPVSAQDLANYQISCGGVSVSVLQAELSPDGQMVILTLSAPLDSGSSCILMVSGIRDLCGNVIRGYQYPLYCTPDPCRESSGGTEFWLTFPGNYAPDRTNPPQVKLYITGAPGTLGNVSMPGSAYPFSANFIIPAEQFTNISLPRRADLGNANDMVSSNGIRVIASSKINVYGYNHIPYTSDGYLGLSTHALGTAYFVMAYQNVFANTPELNGVEFAIVATGDGTTVTIVPSVAVGSHPANVPFNVVLMRGQTYQLRNTNGTPADLTGTFITADQPIGVFSGHQVASIPSGNYFFCDYIVEQLFPVNVWGTHFVTVPLWPRSNDTFRVMAMLDGTTISLNGVPFGAPLNQGQFREFQLTASADISASAPVLVAQFIDSSDYDGFLFADPSMILVPPTSLYSESFVVESSYDSFFNAINVMAPNTAIGQISFDGLQIPPGFFNPVPGTVFSATPLLVSAGPHTLICSNGVRFGVIVYGGSEYESYGYPGGLCGSAGRKPPTFTCPPTNIYVQVGADCTGTVPDLSTMVGNGDLALKILQDPLPGTVLPPGDYPVTVTIIDQYGERHLCTSILTITPGSSPGMRCPADIVTNCAAGGGPQQVFYSVSLCNTNYLPQCTPPSGSYFPEGTNQVVCRVQMPTGGSEQCAFNVDVLCARLALTRGSNYVTLQWSGAASLQKATNVTGPYITIPNATSPYSNYVTGTQSYFRLTQ